MSTDEDKLPPHLRAKANELRAAYFARMQSRDQEAYNVALSWALQGRTRLNGRLRVGDELRERPAPRREDLPVAVRLREDGQSWYSPSRVGVFLRLRPEGLARRAGVAVSELDAWPLGPNLQAYLAAVVEVLIKAVAVHGSDERLAAIWFLECALPEFDGCTADKMVRAGQQRAVVEYLDKRPSA